MTNENLLSRKMCKDENSAESQSASCRTERTALILLDERDQKQIQIKGITNVLGEPQEWQLDVFFHTDTEGFNRIKSAHYEVHKQPTKEKRYRAFWLGKRTSSEGGKSLSFSFGIRKGLHLL